MSIWTRVIVILFFSLMVVTVVRASGFTVGILDVFFTVEEEVSCEPTGELDLGRLGLGTVKEFKIFCTNQTSRAIKIILEDDFSPSDTRVDIDFPDGKNMVLVPDETLSLPVIITVPLDAEPDDYHLQIEIIRAEYP